MKIAHEKQPFAEAVNYFRNKVNIPTDRWNDLWQGEHAKGFMMAGATKAQLLADMHGAILKAMEKGTTLAEFQKDFDAASARHGWDFKGGRSWRAETIYGTNIRTAYAAGRWQQMTDPEVVKLRPYLEYRHGDSVHPRQKHLEWDGLVLPADDPWWETHYGPNGWGCKCRAFNLSARDLKRMGKTGPDTAPEIKTRPWTDKKTGQVHEVPEGIDPGWAYNPGMATGETFKALAQPLERLPVPVAKKCMGEMLNQPAFDLFYQGKIAGEFPVAVLTKADQAVLGTSAQTVWLSSETLAKNVAHHPDLGIEDYRLIPEIIDQGEVYRQAEERLVYLHKGDVLYRAALKRTRKGDETFFLSLFKTGDVKADAEVRRRYERVR